METGPRFLWAMAATLVLYIIGRWAANCARAILLKAASKRALDPTFTVYLANVLHGVIMVLVIITALGQLGVPTAQFAALIAAAGLAIGLALQGNLANFASGFLLVFFRPFKRGDYLSAAGTEGHVEEIGLFTTTLLTPDNKTIVVPNSSITGGNITNFSANPLRRVSVTCTVASSNAPEKVRASLLRAAIENPLVVKEPAPIAVLIALGENKFTMELRAWCKTAEFADAQFSLNEGAKVALDMNGIDGPQPTMRLVES